MLLPAKDAWGAAFCCGTSSVIRFAAAGGRSAGFRPNSVTEDYLLTLRMQGDGFTHRLSQRAAVARPRAGRPQGIRHTARAAGASASCRSSAARTAPISATSCGFRDRLSLIESLLYWTAGFAFRLACLVVPILYLVFNVRALDVDLVSGVSHFLPYYISQVVVISWLSERRVLPIVTDLTQLLAAREVLRAAVVGLLRPGNRKFQVTAKGGDRSIRLVQWRMLVMFSLLLALTIAGVVVTFTLDPQRSWQGSAAVALYWSWYNIAILVAAVAVCIERPRFRKNERLAVSDVAWVGAAGEWHAFPMRDVSISGMRLVGHAPSAVGNAISVRVGGQELPARIARDLPGEFAISVDDTIEARRAMINLVHSGRFHQTQRSVSARRVAQRMLIRVLG